VNWQLFRGHCGLTLTPFDGPLTARGPAALAVFIVWADGIVRLVAIDENSTENARSNALTSDEAKRTTNRLYARSLDG
jgi:hypothetical protein